MLGFCVTAPLIDVFSKLAVATLPVGEVTAARFLVQALALVPVVLLMRPGLRLPPGVLRVVALRAAFVSASTFSFISAIRQMPLADALAIAFVEPFIILLWGRFFFQEPVGRRRLVASIIGFAGVLLVIQPSFQRFGAVALWPLGTAASFAAYMLVTRRLSGRMHPVAMHFHTSWIAALICVTPLALIGTGDFAAGMPGGHVWLWLAGVGLASTFSHMLMTYAFANAATTVLAPLHYLELVSATAFGWLIWRDFPNPLAWAGIAVVIGSGLYIIHREVLAHRRAAPQEAARPSAARP
ncbi:MAG: DMT family transporter [Rubellimicrobium sp.]|nr:DMT family transporter [Rubellimicrobium sp.]